MHTKIVPKREYLVNGSPKIKVAKMVLNTRPDYAYQPRFTIFYI